MTMGEEGCAIGKSLGHNQQLGGVQFVSDLRRSRFVNIVLSRCVLRFRPLFLSLSLFLSISPTFPPSLRPLPQCHSISFFLSLSLLSTTPSSAQREAEPRFSPNKARPRSLSVFRFYVCEVYFADRKVKRQKNLSDVYECVALCTHVCV